MLFYGQCKKPFFFKCPYENLDSSYDGPEPKTANKKKMIIPAFKMPPVKNSKLTENQIIDLKTLLKII